MDGNRKSLVNRAGIPPRLLLCPWGQESRLAELWHQEKQWYLLQGHPVFIVGEVLHNSGMSHPPTKMSLLRFLPENAAFPK